MCVVPSFLEGSLGTILLWVRISQHPTCQCLRHYYPAYLEESSHSTMPPHAVGEAHAHHRRSVISYSCGGGDHHPGIISLASLPHKCAAVVQLERAILSWCLTLPLPPYTFMFNAASLQACGPPLPADLSCQCVQLVCLCIQQF